MDTSRTSGPDPGSIKRAQMAFSLVEVTLAIGIVAFAFMSVFGLIPAGLSTFHQAMNASVESQIMQRVINEVQQTDFSTLTQSGSTAFCYTWTLPNKTPSQVRYFDGQGDEVTVPAQAIYQVNTRVMPVTVMPYTGAQTSQVSNTDLATVTIQVACNPARQPLALATAANSPLYDLWTGAFQSNPSNTGAVPIVSFSAMVSRNQ
jgi:uncharacterized protein (TIGR02598 family)